MEKITPLAPVAPISASDSDALDEIVSRVGVAVVLAYITGVVQIASREYPVKATARRVKAVSDRIWKCVESLHAIAAVK